MSASNKKSAFWQQHQAKLQSALTAINARTYWAGFPESHSPKIHGEHAHDEGRTAFEKRLGQSFRLENHPFNGQEIGGEVSPYGLALNVKYPQADINQLISAAHKARQTWQTTSIETRTGICLEILERLSKKSFELAYAVMHVTGQSFVMAFQAGTAHAQDRALEAIAYAHAEMSRAPAQAVWEKPMGKHAPIKMNKHYHIVPRGIALTIGCITFPTWNSYPGIFASLVTGNAVIIKPHPKAILPLAISIETAREVIAEAGFDPNILLLAADEIETPITKELVVHKDIAIIDYTGSNTFADWIREHGRQAQIYTEEAGINPIVIAGTSNFKGMCGNIAMSLSLYSGQMCTAPQNIFIPETGIETDEGHKSFADISAGLKLAVDKLLSDKDRATAILGALASETTQARIKQATQSGEVLRESTPIEGVDNPNVVTPLMLIHKGDDSVWHEEWFGPISFLIATKNADHAVDLAHDSIIAKGAITAAIYAADEKWLDVAALKIATAGALVSCNLYGHILVNQTAAFSDYHVSGLNPAGNASFSDTAFVANRFRIAAIREPT